MSNANSTVAKLHDAEERGNAARRYRAITAATGQMEAIFAMLIVCAQHERSEIPGWPIDPEALPDIIRALAIRGQDLNSAVMSARLGEVIPEDLEALVFRGDHIFRAS